MKYKVGDIVKLRDDLEGGIEIGDYYYSREMSNFKGEKVTIVEADEKGKNYSIEEDRRLHYWTDEMIEGLWEETKPKLKLIDILNKIANGELKEGTVVKLGENDSYEYKGIDDWFMVQCKYLNNEVELIEPQEPKECEHEWREWSLGNRFQVTHYRKCDKCGLEEETEYNHFADIEEMAEPTDNTKIEELDENKYILKGMADVVVATFYKLNEVISVLNKRS